MGYIDYTGQKFNRLTATRRIGLKNENSIWEFECECGKVVQAAVGAVKSGVQKSCGCWKIERNKEKRVYVAPPGKYEDTRRKIFTDYYNSAKKRGYDFELDQDRFYEIIVKPCQYCGKQASSVSEIRSHTRYDRPRFIYSGLDRVDNRKGYTEDNVVPCCTQCNYLKRAFNKDTFISQVKAIYEHTFL